MLGALSEDQEFFRATTQRFLNEHASPAELRRRRHDPAGFGDGYWRHGAELGWTSLLVDAAHGGGTISGAGLLDLSLVAYEFGRRAAPGPLLSTNVAAWALSTNGAHADVLTGLLTGERIVTWCAPVLTAGLGAGALRPGVSMHRQGTDYILEGRVPHVESAAQASHFLVSARDETGVTQVLVPSSVAGVTIETMGTVDLSRRFGAVRFDGVAVGPDAVVGAPLEAATDVERQFHLALSILNAEAVGTLQSGFDMTLEWAFDRYSFGRPLASYQALKHRFADMLTWLEASHAISSAACQAVEERSAAADELVSTAKAYVGQYGADLLQDCVQLHGGIGITFEHDLHLFLRRFIVNRSLAGTPAVHRQRIAAIVEQRNEVAA
ncbi:MAG TPA: acyl-CoA dehydrogenase family protein [Acidimicrobiales bacterium]|jgi:alkylation response protein AidB-like acyl-CoA dehydrogenase